MAPAPSVTRIRRRRLIVLLAVAAVPAVAWSAAPPVAGRESKTSLNVLFIGNSMTWFCNMPRTVAELAEKTDPPVQLNICLATYAVATLEKSHTPEGSRSRKAIAGEITEQLAKMTTELAWTEKQAEAEPANVTLKADLARLQTTLKALQGKPKWDVVVIQPWGADDKDAAKLAAHVKVLQDDIAKASPGARVIIYMDPTRRMDSAKNEKAIREAMEVYRQLAVSNAVEVAPAALACLLINQEKPEYWLKIQKLPKDAHQGLRGSYAIACTIFATLFDRSPVGLPVQRMEAHYQIGGKSTDAQGKSVRVEGKTHMQYFDDGSVQMLSDEDMKFMQAKSWQARQEWKEFCRASK